MNIQPVCILATIIPFLANNAVAEITWLCASDGASTPLMTPNRSAAECEKLPPTDIEKLERLFVDTRGQLNSYRAYRPNRLWLSLPHVEQSNFPSLGPGALYLNKKMSF